jgi:tRNA pseudouridine-54 N-methylase
MATVGELLVKIRADVKELESKMDRAKNKVKQTQTNFRKQMGSTNKVSTEFQKRMSNAATATAALQGPLGPVAGRMRSLGALFGSAGFALGGLVLAIAGAVAAFRALAMASSRAEQATAKFEALVKSTGGAAGLTVRQLEVMAREFARTTLFSVQQMRDAQGILLTFKSVAGEAFGRTISVATDVAQVMGTDVRSAVVQLGKALEEPRIGLSMLRRSGISFTQDQKELIFSLSDTNQKAAAMSEILTIIENQLGGTAAAAAGEGDRTTLAGAFDELTRKFTLFQEEILGGTTLLKMFTKAINDLADAIPVLDIEGLDISQLKEVLQTLNADLERTIKMRDDFAALSQFDATGQFTIMFEKFQKDVIAINAQIRKVEAALNAAITEQAETMNVEPAGEGDFTLSKVFQDAEKRARAFALSNQLLADSLGMAGAELEVFKMQQAFLNKLQVDNIDITDEQRLMIEKLFQATLEQAQALEDLQKIYGAFDSAISKAFSTVENSIMGLIDGTKSLKDVMKNMLAAFIADVTRSIIKLLILDRIKKSIMGSSTTGSFAGAIAGAIFGRNTGGSVGSKTPYVVGEQGPELFIPNTSGRIQPLNKAGENMGSPQTPVVVEQHINFATGVQSTVRAEVANLLPQIQNSTIAAVQEARMRGGKFAESFGG